jgi:glyoxylase-like metal-dependent hydrolase (beta-lactamase superfamily II)
MGVNSSLQIPGLQVFERGWLSANNILLTDEISSSLIDSGYVTHQDQTLALVQHALNGRTLDRLINTHLHSDHCGGNALLQQTFPDLETWIPPGEAEGVRSWNQSLLSYEPTGQLCPQFSLTHLLQPGQSLYMANLEWQIHAAPGHDPHSVILFEPSQRVLISADALWENGFGVVFPELEGIAAFDEVGLTLDLIESLNPRWIIPGHGAVFNDVSGALQNARKKLNSFVQSPAKHARYGAKVLLKYKLLELHQVEKQAFFNWAQQVKYFKVLHALYAADSTVTQWLEELIEDLARSQALTKDGSRLLNQ